MASRNTELVKARARPGGTSEGNQRNLQRFFNQQVIRDARKRAQSNTPKGGPQVSRNARLLLRAIERKTPLAQIARQAGQLMLGRGMPGIGVPYGDGTRTGRSMNRACGVPNGNGGCSDRQTFGVATCVLGQFSDPSGACQASSNIPQGAGYHELRQYSVNAPINWRRGSAVFFNGTGYGGVPGRAIPAGETLVAVPARGRLPYGRPSDVGIGDGGAYMPGAGGARVGWQPMAPRWPQLDPAGLPIGQPAPLPIPPPYRVLPERQPNPWAPDTAQPQWGPGPARNPHPWEPSPMPAPEAPTKQPTAGPTIGIDPVPGQPPKVDPKPQPHLATPNGVPRRTRQRVRERKITVQNTATRAALKIVNLTTESCDAINAFFKALPEKVRQRERLDAFNRKRRELVQRKVPPNKKDLTIFGGSRIPRWKGPELAYTCKDKAAALYKHWDKVDMRKAMSNLAENEVEDRAFGKTGQGLKKGARKTSPRTHDGIGYQSGGSVGKTPDGVPTGPKPWDGMFDGIFGVGG